MSILSVQDISKSFKLRKVVKTLSIEIKSGEVVGLLGPNGAGKTTAFYMIVGLIPADKGTILLDGHDLTALPMHRRARMGLELLNDSPGNQTFYHNSACQKRNRRLRLPRLPAARATESRAAATGSTFGLRPGCALAPPSWRAPSS